jgi:hypothetical protein
VEEVLVEGSDVDECGNPDQKGRARNEIRIVTIPMVLMALADNRLIMSALMPCGGRVRTGLNPGLLRGRLPTANNANPRLRVHDLDRSSVRQWIEDHVVV